MERLDAKESKHVQVGFAPLKLFLALVDRRGLVRLDDLLRRVIRGNLPALFERAMFRLERRSERVLFGLLFRRRLLTSRGKQVFGNDGQLFQIYPFSKRFARAQHVAFKCAHNLQRVDDSDAVDALGVIAPKQKCELDEPVPIDPELSFDSICRIHFAILFLCEKVAIDVLGSKQKHIAIIGDDGVHKAVFVEIRALCFGFLRCDDVRNTKERQELLYLSIHVIRYVLRALFRLSNLVLQLSLLFLGFFEHLFNLIALSASLHFFSRRNPRLFFFRRFFHRRELRFLQSRFFIVRERFLLLCLSLCCRR